MKEELGLERNHLAGQELLFVAGYKSCDEDERRGYFNTEWRDIYSGLVQTDHVHQSGFDDGEVVGLNLCPAADAGSFLSKTFIPLASALKATLPLYLQWLGNAKDTL